MLLAVAGLVGGALLLGIAAYQHFAITSNFHPDYQVDNIWDSASGEPLVIPQSGEYGVTSLRGALESCTLTSEDGVVITPVLDESIEKRPVFRFQSPARSYPTVECAPDDVWFEVFKGEDVRSAATGWDGAVHPSLVYLGAGVASFAVGMIFWSRFVKRPQDWPAS